jgi:hypothetical protein
MAKIATKLSKADKQHIAYLVGKVTEMANDANEEVRRNGYYILEDFEIIDSIKNFNAWQPTYKPQMSVGNFKGT